MDAICNNNVNNEHIIKEQCQADSNNDFFWDAVKIYDLDEERIAKLSEEQIQKFTTSYQIIAFKNDIPYKEALKCTTKEVYYKVIMNSLLEEVKFEDEKKLWDPWAKTEPCVPYDKSQNHLSAKFRKEYCGGSEFTIDGKTYNHAYEEVIISAANDVKDLIKKSYNENTKLISSLLDEDTKAVALIAISKIANDRISKINFLKDEALEQSIDPENLEYRYKSINLLSKSIIDQENAILWGPVDNDLIQAIEEAAKQMEQDITYIQSQAFELGATVEQASRFVDQKQLEKFREDIIWNKRTIDQSIFQIFDCAPAKEAYIQLKRFSMAT